MSVSNLTLFAYLSRSFRALFAASAFFICLAGAANGQSALDGFNPNPNGTVRVIVVQPDGKILIGGDFNALAPNGGATVTRNFIARLKPDGTLDAAFNPNADNAVFAIALQADGSVIVGGEFTNIGGAARNRLARLDAVTGAADTSFDPNANDSVRALAVHSNGMILVAGEFTNIGGAARNRLARLHATGPDTGLVDLSFNPDVNADIVALAVQADRRILIGGDFTTVSGTMRNHIARLNANGSLDTTFNPNASGAVRSIGVQADGKIVAGGFFINIGGQPRNHIARLNAADGSADSFDPNSDGDVHVLALQLDGKIVIAGEFSNVSGQLRSRIARIDAVTGTADSFDPNAGNGVYSLAVQSDGKILAGGQFSSFGGQTRNFLARGERDGRLDQTLDLGVVGDVVHAIVLQPDGKILIGGRFNTVLGVTRNHIARLNTDGTLDTAFDPNSGAEIDAIVLQADGRIIAGGHFSTMGGQPRNRIARLDPVTGAVDLTFDPNANHNVRTLAVQADGMILAGGQFTNIGGTPRACIARLDTTGTLDLSFDPSASSDVLSIAVQSDGMIVAGGEFVTIGGQMRRGIARLHATGPNVGMADTSFNALSNGDVLGVALQANGMILAGGRFSGIGGQTRNFIARLDAAGAADSFNPDADGFVYTITVQADGRVLAGGTFINIGGQPRSLIARLDGVTGAADSFDPSGNVNVHAIAVQADGKVLVGGEFTAIGGETREHFARLSNDTAALQDLAVTETTVTWTHDGASPQFTRVVFEQSTDGVNYTFLGNGTSSLTGGKGQFAPTASTWALTGLALPTGQNLYIRARGFYRSGYLNGSESKKESVRNVFLVAPNAASVSISGRVSAGKGFGVGKAIVSLSGAGGVRTALTNAFGFYRFDEVEVGRTYVISVSSKRYQFEPQVVFVTEDVEDLNFTAEMERRQPACKDCASNLKGFERFAFIAGWQPALRRLTG